MKRSLLRASKGAMFASSSLYRSPQRKQGRCVRRGLLGRFSVARLTKRISARPVRQLRFSSFCSPCRGSTLRRAMSVSKTSKLVMERVIANNLCVHFIALVEAVAEKQGMTPTPDTLDSYLGRQVLNSPAILTDRLLFAAGAGAGKTPFGDGWPESAVTANRRNFPRSIVSKVRGLDQAALWQKMMVRHR